MKETIELQWVWVVVSRNTQKVSRSMCEDYGMQVFMRGHAGGRIFFCRELAHQFKAMLLTNTSFKMGYKTRIVPDKDFMEECDEYRHNHPKLTY